VITHPVPVPPVTADGNEVPTTEEFQANATDTSEFTPGSVTN